MSTELIDVLNENGVLTGEVLPRSEIHKRGLWHRAIAVAIINEKNEILLQQRSKNKEKNAGMWDILLLDTSLLDRILYPQLRVR